MKIINKIRCKLMNLTPFEFAHFFGYESSILTDATKGFFIEIKRKQMAGLYCLGELERALVTSASHGFINIVTFLIENKVKVTKENNLALRNACKLGYKDIVEILLKNGANVNANNNEAIKIAAYKGYLDIVKLLVMAGADIHVDKDMPMRNASKRGHFNIVKYFQSLGVNILTTKVCIDAIKYDNLDFLIDLKNLGFKLENYDFLFTSACFNCSINIISYMIHDIPDQYFNESYLLKITQDRDISKKWMEDYIRQIRYREYFESIIPIHKDRQENKRKKI